MRVLTFRAPRCVDQRVLGSCFADCHSGLYEGVRLRLRLVSMPEVRDGAEPGEQRRQCVMWLVVVHPAVCQNSTSRSASR